MRKQLQNLLVGRPTPVESLTCKLFWSKSVSSKCVCEDFCDKCRKLGLPAKRKSLFGHQQSLLWSSPFEVSSNIFATKSYIFQRNVITPQKEEMERKRGNGERGNLFVSSLSLHFLILSPFPHNPIFRLPQVVPACWLVGRFTTTTFTTRPQRSQEFHSGTGRDGILQNPMIFVKSKKFREFFGANCIN